MGMRHGRKLAIGVVIGLAALLAGGIATAAVPSDDGSIHVCVGIDGKGAVKGDLRILDPDAAGKDGTCKKNEMELVLNTQELPATCAEGQVIKLVGGAWSCAADEDTTYDAGTGLGLDGTTFSVDPNTVQSRVTGACAENEAIQSIDADGNVVCDPDDDTTYSAGTGLQLSGTQFSVDPSSVQSRVTGTCAPTQAIRAVAANGSVTCAAITEPRVLAPAAAQISTTEGERVLLEAHGVQIVGKCADGAGTVDVRVASGGFANVVSDSRKHTRGQTVSPGVDLTIGTADGGSLDRGDFNISHQNTQVLNGSFYVVLVGGSCQFNASATRS
jgi:hypothetical protein